MPWSSLAKYTFKLSGHFFPLLLWWVELHCGIYTGSYVSNTSHMNSPPQPFSFNSPPRLSSCLSFLSLSSYTHAFFTQSLYILYILLIYLLDLHSISYVTFLLYWLCTLMHRNFDIVQFFYFSFCSLCFCVMSKKWSLTSLMFFSLFFSDFYSFSFTFKSLIHSELIFV
jgi:hypothetical protein